MGKNTDDHGNNDEEVLLAGSDEDLDDDMNDEGGERPTPSANHKLVIVRPLKSGPTNPPLNDSITVRGKTGDENGGYNHAPEEGGRQDREALEILTAMSSHEGGITKPDAGTNGIAAQVNEILEGEASSGPARLEKDLASAIGKLPPLKMKYGPVSFWKRRTVQAIAALGLIGVVGGSAYKIWEQLQASPDETEEVAKPILPVAVPVNKSAAEESPQAATLYDEVGNKLEAKTEGSDLSQGTKARIHAASTNDLTESLYDGAKRWETLDGKWLDTPGAHANVVKKLTTWGGYQDVLTVSANANSIDEMLEDIANSDLPHAEHVAWKVAVQIASIKDSRVVPSVEEVETRLNTVDSATIDQTLDENIQNPPPVPGPSFFADQEASQTGSLDSGLYDAPEPVSLLAKAAQVEAQIPTAVWVEEVEEMEKEVTVLAPRFEDRFDVVEPAHVKPVVETKAENPVVPVLMDPTEAAEPVALLAKREAEIPDVTEFMELEEEAKPAPKPVPTLMENAKSAFSSLTSRFKSWLS